MLERLVSSGWLISLLLDIVETALRIHGLRGHSRPEAIPAYAKKEIKETLRSFQVLNGAHALLVQNLHSWTLVFH